jgi:hypothetical protein
MIGRLFCGESLLGLHSDYASRMPLTPARKIA